MQTVGFGVSSNMLFTRTFYMIDSHWSNLIMHRILRNKLNHTIFHPDSVPLLLKKFD